MKTMIKLNWETRGQALTQCGRNPPNKCEDAKIWIVVDHDVKKWVCVRYMCVHIYVYVYI